MYVYSESPVDSPKEMTGDDNRDGPNTRTKVSSGSDTCGNCKGAPGSKSPGTGSQLVSPTGGHEKK